MFAQAQVGPGQGQGGVVGMVAADLFKQGRGLFGGTDVHVEINQGQPVGQAGRFQLNGVPGFQNGRAVLSLCDVGGCPLHMRGGVGAGVLLAAGGQQRQYQHGRQQGGPSGAVGSGAMHGVVTPWRIRFQSL